MHPSNKSPLLPLILLALSPMACGDDARPSDDAGDGDSFGTGGSTGQGSATSDATDSSPTSQGGTTMATGSDGGSTDAGTMGDDTSDPDDTTMGEPPCFNLECQQPVCPAGATTTVSGVVTIPSGDLPLPNVYVYIPNTDLQALPEGVTCSQCQGMNSVVPSLGDPEAGTPLVLTITDFKGEFVLEDAPAGVDIPIVVQIGKWRRQMWIPSVEPCEDNVVDPELTRLPRNQQEGNLPKMAITDGGCDNLHCLLRKAGIDQDEFTHESDTGRVNIYRGSGGMNSYNGFNLTAAPGWWADLANLLPYDIILHSCECGQNLNGKPQAAREAMRDFADLGGRVFASHWHNVWLQHGPADFQSVGTWNGQSANNPANIDTSFPKGEVLADWMFEYGGSPVHGQVHINDKRHTLGSIDETLAQQWLWMGNQSIQYMSFNTPVGADDDQQCGRFVFSDMHVSSSCAGTDLTPQEMVLIYMLFDIASCVEPDQPMPQ
jgi:hypothetical protein